MENTHNEISLFNPFGLETLAGKLLREMKNDNKTPAIQLFSEEGARLLDAKLIKPVIENETLYFRITSRGYTLLYKQSCNILAIVGR